MKKITWQEIDEAISKIAETIKEAPINVKNVYGIPRGGLVVAVMLSHRLGVPLILNANEITYDTLVCDDIVDTGKTLAKLSEDHITATVAIVYKENDKYRPSIFVYEKENEWILFPWETKESSRYDGTVPVDN